MRTSGPLSRAVARSRHGAVGPPLRTTLHNRDRLDRGGDLAVRVGNGVRAIRKAKTNHRGGLLSRFQGYPEARAESRPCLVSGPWEPSAYLVRADQAGRGERDDQRRADSRRTTQRRFDLKKERRQDARAALRCRQSRSSDSLCDPNSRLRLGSSPRVEGPRCRSSSNMR